eukprot:m.150907 g.150907  ORF g.150907 m.150907 type:complete len:1497 (+) comp30749_c0_seq1:408-4898(+)
MMLLPLLVLLMLNLQSVSTQSCTEPQYFDTDPALCPVVFALNTTRCCDADGEFRAFCNSTCCPVSCDVDIIDNSTCGSLSDTKPALCSQIIAQDPTSCCPADASQDSADLAEAFRNACSFTCCSITCERNTTVSPTSSPTIELRQFIAQCGSNNTVKCEPPALANATDSYFVRCCSDLSIGSWIRNSPTCPYAASEFFSNVSDCQLPMTHTEATNFCGQFGGGSGRLCTSLELQNDCAKSSGCGLNSKLVWTSNTMAIATSSPITSIPTASPTSVPSTSSAPTPPPFTNNCHGVFDPGLCELFLPSDCIPRQLTEVCTAMCGVSCAPSASPTFSLPTSAPTLTPTTLPTLAPATSSPTTSKPTNSPSASPTKAPASSSPTLAPTGTPTVRCSDRSFCDVFSQSDCAEPRFELETYCPRLCNGTACPTIAPSMPPTLAPTTLQPTLAPTSVSPTLSPVPSASPTQSESPTVSPTAAMPTTAPSNAPTLNTARPAVILTLEGVLVIDVDLNTRFETAIIQQALSRSVANLGDGVVFNVTQSDLVDGHIQVTVAGDPSKRLSTVSEAHQIAFDLLQLVPLTITTTAADDSNISHVLKHVCAGLSYPGQKSPCSSIFDDGFEAVGEWRLARCGDYVEASCQGSLGLACDFDVTYEACVDSLRTSVACHNIQSMDACVSDARCRYIDDGGTSVFSGCYDDAAINSSGFLQLYNRDIPKTIVSAAPTVSPTVQAFPSSSSSLSFTVTSACRTMNADSDGCVALPQQTFLVGSGYHLGALTSVTTTSPAYELGDVAVHVTGLPTGMVFDSQNGSISGIPQASGNYVVIVFVFRETEQLRAVVEEIEITVLDPTVDLFAPSCTQHDECKSTPFDFTWGDFDHNNQSYEYDYRLPGYPDSHTCQVQTEISSSYFGIREDYYNSNPYLEIKGGHCPTIERGNCQRKCCNPRLVPLQLSSEFRQRILFMVADGRTYVDDVAFPGDPSSWFSPCAWCGGDGELDGCVKCIEGWGKNEAGTCEPCLMTAGKTINRHGMCVDCACPEGSRLLGGCLGDGVVDSQTFEIVGNLMTCDRCKTDCGGNNESDHYFVQKCSSTSFDDNECVRCSTCPSEHFKVGGCEFNNVTRGDTVCDACQVCNPDSSAPHEISPCTPLSDRVCGKLPSTGGPTMSPSVTPTSLPTVLPSQVPSVAIVTSTVPPVTSAPTVSPATRTPTASPTRIPTQSPMFACSNNCGTTDKGGGTCLNATCIRCCTSCDSDQVLASVDDEGVYLGRCYPSTTCKNNKYLTAGPLKGYPCTCDDKKCFQCDTTFNASVCTKCKSGFYLLDGECVKSCPPTLTSLGTSNFGRRCLDPFTCTFGRIVDQLFSYSCKCVDEENVKDKNCQTCNFEAGAFGQKCTRCTNNMFLFNGSCHADCSAFPDTISYTPGTNGRECRAPFTCTAGLDETLTSCKCPASVGGTACGACLWSAQPTLCLYCASDRHYSEGACVKECPVGQLPVENTIFGGTECS